VVEGKLTPTSVRHGLNPQQQAADQLPALFRPRHIKALASKTDPQHPMKGMAVGASEARNPARTGLAETMADIEEDMLSKVKKDLTTYLDRLEKKARIDRELKDKAVDAVEKGRAEEDQDMAEDPTAQDVMTAPPPPPQEDPTLPESVAIETVTFEDQSVFEIHGDQQQGFEIRHRGRSLPTRFPAIDHARMALDLFRARRDRPDLSADYIDER
jgi:hypothetical protein